MTSRFSFKKLPVVCDGTVDSGPRHCSKPPSAATLPDCAVSHRPSGCMRSRKFMNLSLNFHILISTMAVDPEQVQRAAKSLLKHMKRTRDELVQNSTKKSLDDEESTDGEEPIWLILTMKEHIVQKNSLKPRKMYVSSKALFFSPELTNHTARFLILSTPSLQMAQHRLASA